jgi:hypothetical protein
MRKISPPSFDSLNDYYKSYWKNLDEDDILNALVQQQSQTVKFISGISAAMENYRYREGKWMVKEVIGHLCDTERILTYRALCFARNDKTHLPAFDEDAYVEKSNFSLRNLKDITEEWNAVRTSSVLLFNSMTDEILDRTGIANNNKFTPRILLYFVLVHERHHLGIINERYLSSATEGSVNNSIFERNNKI